MSTSSFSSNEWRKGTGEDVILGTEDINDIDTISFQNIVEPLDRVLANYVQGATLVYNTGATINISAGSVVCSNSAGTVRKMRLNTSTVSATFAGNLDTGAEAGSTVYTIWSSCDADATTFTVKISASSTAPSGVTSYAKLGNFFNNSSSDIDRTKIYTVPNGNIRADSNGAGLVTDIRDYASSTSSYTAKTGADLKIAFGTSTNPFTITNLPFTSSSSYRVSCNWAEATNQSQELAILSKSASSFSCDDSQTNPKSVEWIAVGF